MRKKEIVIFLVTATVILLILYSVIASRRSHLDDPEYTTNLKLFDEIDSVYDDSKIFDLKFNYLINGNTCDNYTDILAVLIVTSYFGDVETRSAMRRSFSSEKLKILGLRRVFLLGMAPQDKYTSTKSVEDEARKFGDIVQGNFEEAYRNLTYKHVMGLKWVAKFCSNAKYVVKMDDDIVVNVIEFVDLLKTIKIPKNAIAGYILRDMLPIREPYNKWYVTKEEFAEDTYPPFASGWLYITTPDTIKHLLVTLVVMHAKYFWIDDVFVSGILVRKARVRHYDLSKYYAIHSEYMDCCIGDIKRHHLKCDFLIGPNGGDNNLFFKFNEALKICHINPCHDRENPIEDTCVTNKKINLSKGVAVIHSYKLH